MKNLSYWTEWQQEDQGLEEDSAVILELRASRKQKVQPINGQKSVPTDPKVQRSDEDARLPARNQGCKEAAVLPDAFSRGAPITSSKEELSTQTITTEAAGGGKNSTAQIFVLTLKVGGIAALVLGAIWVLELLKG